MAKDKLSNLVTYQQELKYKLTGPVPSKHTNHPELTRRFSRTNFELSNLKLNSLKANKETI